MRRIRCIAVSAEGGFKIINGPPKNGKGPMESEEYQKMSKGASPSRPTQAGRIETCTELISKAMRCLENNDKDYVMKLIEELVRSQCHNGNAVGREVADKVRDIVHELWLVSDDEHRCGLLKMLKDLGISKTWVKMAAHMANQYLDKYLAKCSINWEGRATRNDVVKDLENLLGERFGWSEARMCEELWQFVGVDVDEFRRHGIEPCSWLNGLEELSDLRRPYWLGLRASDLAIVKLDYEITLEIGTTNSIDAVFFPVLLGTIKTPGLAITWKESTLTTKYVHKSINLMFFVHLNTDAWPWPIKLSAYELKRMIENFSDEELAEYIAGEVDGDGAVLYGNYSDAGYKHIEYVTVLITACKDCPKRMVLDVLKEIIARRFGIIGNIYQLATGNALIFYNRNAVRLLRLTRPFIHHPLKRLRAELILALYDGRISREAFEKLYEMTEYEYGGPDVKRNNALEALARAAPQTHTHGIMCIIGWLGGFLILPIN